MTLVPVILPPGRARLAMNPEPDRITGRCHDDGYHRRCAADCDHRRRAPCNDDIDFAADKFSHDAGILVE